MIPSAQEKKFSRYHFFACKYGFISNDMIYLFFLDSKKVEVDKINDVNVYEKKQRVIHTIYGKIVIFLLVFLNLISFKKESSLLFVVVLFICALIFFFIKIEVVVFNINCDNKIEFKICKKEFRKAKLFKKKILEYKKHLELNEFYN